MADRKQYYKEYAPTKNSKRRNRYQKDEQYRNSLLAKFRLPENLERRKFRRLYAEYGLTKTGYEDLLKAQAGGCAICGRKDSAKGRKLAVDHDHITGKVRGLLCANHNIGLGKFGDSEQLLTRAILYLIRNRE